MAAGAGSRADYVNMSYADLVHLAEDQRRRINDNNALIHSKEAKVRVASSGRAAEVAARLRTLRAEAARESAELARLQALDSGLGEQRQRNAATKGELDSLQSVFASKEWELRNAVSKVDTLRGQLEELKRRRQNAATAALAMASAAAREELRKKRGELSGVDGRIADLRAAMAAAARPDRPKAAVEPFHVAGKTPNGTADKVNGTSVKAALNLPLGQPTRMREDKMSPDKASLGDLRRKAASLFRGKGPAPPPPDSTTASPSPKRQAPAPPVPTSPASTTSERSSLSSTESERGNKRAPLMAPLHEHPMSDLLPNTNSSSNTTANNSQPSLNNKYKKVESDMLHIRLDNLRAAKRRSWASQNHLETAGPGTEIGGEAEHIRRMLAREQARGKSNINFSYVFESSAERESPCSDDTSETPSTKAGETSEVRPPPPYPFHLIPPPPSSITAPAEEPASSSPSPPGGKSSEASSSLSSSSSSSDSSDETTVSPPTASPFAIPPPPPIGILRTGPRKAGRTNIEFDPLALLLDAALEGELELVKRSARALPDVSRCNDEGITALHNAICAGHYEIVRFLVEAGADVNAADSDGWTPLHCAASCNNLPMVKFLVERGSCVWATTLSDQETPADKCEEDEDGFVGCHNFLIGVLEGMGGTLHGSRVYAAYSYQPEREDELTVQDGEPLSVLDRTTESASETWWQCRSEDGKEGFLPRNYLCLYPRLAFQSQPESVEESGREIDGVGEEEEMVTLAASSDAVTTLSLPDDNTH